MGTNVEGLPAPRYVGDHPRSRARRAGVHDISSKNVGEVVWRGGINQYLEGVVREERKEDAAGGMFGPHVNLQLSTLKYFI